MTPVSVPTAADYLAAGLKLIPISYGSKAPWDDGWQLEENCIHTIEQAGRLNGKNIGIAHLWSGTCAVDADDYLAATTWLAKRGIALDDHLDADDAVQISSGRPNRCKLWYRLPDGVPWLPTLDLRASYGIGLELRCASKDGSATVVDVLPPSVHPDTGRPYEWKGNWRDPPELPQGILALWRELAKNGTKPSAGRSEDGPIPEGRRNNCLASLAGSMRYRGMSEAGIYAALTEENRERCVPPLPPEDIGRIARSVGRYSPGAAREEPAQRGSSPDGGNSEANHDDASGNGKDTSEEATTAPQIIEVRAGELPRIVQDAIEALRGAAVPIYDRGGALYRPVRNEAPSTSDGVRRPVGALVLRLVDAIWVRVKLAASAEWLKLDKREKKALPADPPKDIAEIIGTQSDLGNWDALRGVVAHPVLTPEGRVISTPGYDRDTGLLIEITGRDWSIPAAPTKDDAIEAWGRLKELLRYFPWGSDGDRAVALSLLLTAIARPALPAAPMHCVDSPEAGTGKSLLVDVASILASGGRAPVMDYGRDAVEAGKRLDAMQLAGDPIIAIDNVEAPLEGSVLCQMLSQTVRRIRVMGGHTVVTVPCVSMVTATGNNLVLKGDVVRRAIICRLDAGTERPELRDFDQDLIAEASEYRRELVADIITIMLAYHRAGCPDTGVAVLGGYEPWSYMVRQALCWVGEADPCRSMERTRGDDPLRQNLALVLEAWHDAFGEVATTVAEAVTRAEGDSALREALAAVCEKRGKLDNRALGLWLRGNKDKRSGRLALRAGRTDGHTKMVRWFVTAG